MSRPCVLLHRGEQCGGHAIPRSMLASASYEAQSAQDLVRGAECWDRVQAVAERVICVLHFAFGSTYRVPSTLDEVRRTNRQSARREDRCFCNARAFPELF